MIIEIPKELRCMICGEKIKSNEEHHITIYQALCKKCYEKNKRVK